MRPARNRRCTVTAGRLHCSRDAEAALVRKDSLDRATRKKRGEREAGAATEVRTTERALR